MVGLYYRLSLKREKKISYRYSMQKTLKQNSLVVSIAQYLTIKLFELPNLSLAVQTDGDLKLNHSPPQYSDPLLLAQQSIKCSILNSLSKIYKTESTLQLPKNSLLSNEISFAYPLMKITCKSIIRDIIIDKTYDGKIMRFLFCEKIVAINFREQIERHHRYNFTYLWDSKIFFW